MITIYNPFEIIDGTLIKCKGVYTNRYLSIGEFDEVVRIGSLAFKGNQYIEHLYIGKNIIDIGAEAFSCCSNLKTIEVDEDNPRFSSHNGSNCIIDKQTNCLILGCSTTKIPNDISFIGPFSFCGQNKIKEIEIPSNIKTLYPYSFDGCESLEAIKLNDGLEEIGECCFKGCYKLEKIFIPKTLKMIHDTAFSLLYDEDGILDDGDYLVHEIYFSGLKNELYNIFNINKLFLIENNLSYNDINFHCQDGDFSLTNKDCDY